MKTLKQMATEKRQAIRGDAAKERKELRALEGLAKVWPEDVPLSAVHVNSLYGTVASLRIGSDYQAYGHPDDRLDMPAVARLLDKFPPVVTWKVSDGCLSFRPDADVTDAEAMGDKAEQVWGVRLDIEPGINSGGHSQRVHWFANVGGLLVRIEAVLAPSAYPVAVKVNARRDRRTGKVLEVIECSIDTAPSFPGHFWIDKRVRWAAGSHEYANKFSLYWLAIDDSQGAGRAWLEQVCGMEVANNE